MGPLRWLPPATYAGALLPALLLGADALGGRLGANPLERATHQTGQLSVTLLLLSLACTPLRRWAGWTWPARVRKALGLSAFAYAALHFGLYLTDQEFALPSIVGDVLERPFITSGFVALLMLLPLALTSTPASVRRLGFARWTRLHRWVYGAAALSALHYWWAVKQSRTGPLLVVAALVVLLGWRAAAGQRQGRTPTRSGR